MFKFEALFTLGNSRTFSYINWNLLCVCCVCYSKFEYDQQQCPGLEEGEYVCGIEIHVDDKSRDLSCPFVSLMLLIEFPKIHIPITKGISHT